jgi:cyclase
MKQRSESVRRRFSLALAICAALAGGGTAVAAESNSEAPWVVPVRENVFAIMGAGSNVTVQIGDSGVLVVDSGAEQNIEAVIGLIRGLSDRPIRYLITTHDDDQHRGGNPQLAQSGMKFGAMGSGTVRDEQPTAEIIAHENVLTSISSLEPAPPFEGWPTSTFFTDSKSLAFNREGIDILLVPKAHSDGDTLIYFRQSNVVSAGDIYTPDRYPYFDVSKGGSLQGVIDGLNRLIDMTITDNMQEGGTLVVPGHGRIGNESDVVEYRDMLTIIRNYIQEMIREKRSLAEVQKARPTFGFDPLYAAGTCEWTVEEFVAAIYRELTQKGGRK